MQRILGLGKWMFAIPMLAFGVMHFMAGNDMAGMAPGGVVMVSITGLALILAAISIFIGYKNDVYIFSKGDQLSSCSPFVFDVGSNGALKIIYLRSANGLNFKWIKKNYGAFAEKEDFNRIDRYWDGR